MLKNITAGFTAILLGILAQSALSAFDPVNDDTDIFLANPNITAERPNVLIILDNTANWSTAFTNEKSALVSVVNGLDDRYNVGLMLFNQNQASRQNPLDNGAFVAFHVRQMTSTNKSALASMVGNFVNATYNNNGQKADANPIDTSMYEAYLYYAGKPSRTGWNQTWADFPGNTYAAGQTSYTNSLTDHALPANPTSTSLYNSPIVDGCQKNYIIYISNGAANESNSLLQEMQGKLATLTNTTTPNTISLTPNGQQGNWADELAQYMGSADVNSSVSGTQNVITYTVEVDPNTTGQGPSMSALLNSMASKSGGSYFAVSSGNSGVAITDALNDIFAQVQAENSVFAATTLPVSVNVRGTNLNQVYVGMFRPDAKKSPRWLGNLKAYKLGLNTSDNSLFLVDKDAKIAEDTSTHFVLKTATSFWTSSTLTPTSFWSFRDSSLNGVGLASDAPDGNLVEKGGVAQQLRHYYQSSQTSRNLYTCTTGGSKPDCVPCSASGSGTSQTCSGGSALSATPFDTTNTAISATALNLSTQTVSALTGKRSVSLTALTDRKSATISNLASGTSATATTISSGSGTTTRTISSLTTAAPVTISNVSVGTTTTTTNGNLTWTLVLTHANGNTTSWDVTTGPAPSAPSGGSYTSGPTITSTLSGSVSISGSTGTCTGIGPSSISISSAIAAGTAANTSSGSVTGTQKFNGTATCTVTLATPLASTFSSSASSTGSTATVTTSTPHGFLSGQSVSMNTSNSIYNCSTSAGITVLSATSFTCSLPAAQYSSGSPAITGTVSAVSQVITATTTAAHGYVAGDQVIISGASPSGYNGTYTVLGPTSTVASLGKDSTPTNFTSVTGWPAITTNTFTLVKQTNSTANLLATNTATPVYTVKTTGTTTISSLTLTFASNPFSNGQVLSVNSAAVSGYNTSSCTVTSVTATTATCTLSPTVSGPLPNDTAATATVSNGAVYDNNVTATVTAHGFATGNQIMVESVGSADSNYAGSGAGPYTIIVSDANHFTYTTAFALPQAPTGTYNVRLGGTTNPKAYATATSHGFTTGDSVTISGVTPTAYNNSGTAVNVTVIDANNFTYNLATVSPEDVTKQGAASVLGTASINTTTATATAVNHGFSTGNSIAISGASPSAFNGTFNITVTDTNHFTYTLSSTQGDATGSSILASAASASSTLRDNIINWVRGADNSEDENGNGSYTDIRASIHGDVIHSRPAVINYNRFGGNNDVYVFYGANDGIFRAIKAGTDNDSADTSGLTPGQEVWGFVPTEFFSTLQRIRNNSPTISSSQKKPYFADGPIGVLTIDGDTSGTSGYGMLGGTNDTVNLYIGMRRGGRAIYALDVNTPSNPKLLWKISNATTGFSELGQTWSEPKVVTRDNSLGCSIKGYSNPVLIFGAGYDPTVEDIDPATITSSTTTSITTAAGTFTRSMGRGIYVVDAITGALVVSIGGANSAISPNKVVTGMDYAISSDVTVIKNVSGGCLNRAYVGDTGGNVWRLDFGATYNSASPGDWVTVTKIASIGGTSSNSDRRKFLFGPDVVSQSGFNAVLIGSGDREHPFDSTVTNRMYMFKDRGDDTGPYTGTSTDLLTFTNGVGASPPDGNPDYPTITESRLYDATNNCIQVACSSTTTAIEAATLNAKDGWYVTLGSGEKNVGNVVALGGIVFFNTNQPSSAAGGGSCGSNLGFARQYQVSVADATAVKQLDTTNAALNTADRFRLVAGGGYLPSPVHVVVQFYVSPDKSTVLDATTTSVPPAGYSTVNADGVISGVDVETGDPVPLGTRYRKYWWKEIDQ